MKKRQVFVHKSISVENHIIHDQNQDPMKLRNTRDINFFFITFVIKDNISSLINL